MKAPSYSVHEDGSVHYTPAGAHTPELVGHVVEDEPGIWRAWKANEAPVERLFRRDWLTQARAARSILPRDGFPRLCVRCHEEEPCMDAAAYTAPGPEGMPYPSELDDHCVGCLPAGLDDYVSGFDGNGDRA